MFALDINEKFATYWAILVELDKDGSVLNESNRKRKDEILHTLKKLHKRDHDHENDDSWSLGLDSWLTEETYKSIDVDRKKTFIELHKSDFKALQELLKVTYFMRKQFKFMIARLQLQIKITLEQYKIATTLVTF